MIHLLTHANTKFTAMFIFVLSLLAACAGMNSKSAAAYTVNVAKLTSALTDADREIDDSLQLLKQSSVYSDKERQQLNRLLYDAEFLVNRARQTLNKQTVGQTIINANEADALVAHARSVYFETLELVLPHFSEFSRADQFKLDKLNHDLKLIDAAWREVKNKPVGEDLTPVISAILQITAAVVKVALVP